MPTTNTRVIWLTNDKGKALLPPEEMEDEPEIGSVVLIGGLTGTAWQRHGTTGKWQPCSQYGAPKEWYQIISRRRVVLVYDAPSREEIGQV